MLLIVRIISSDKVRQLSVKTALDEVDELEELARRKENPFGKRNITHIYFMYKFFAVFR